MQSYPNCVFRKLGSSSLWITPELDEDRRLGLLADPDHLFALPECEVVKDQRKIKVGRVSLEIGGEVKRIYLKRYNVFSWRYRLSSLFMRSGASRSWVGAGVLLGAGFNTGRPLAAVECRSWGMLAKSFYISEEIPEAKTADAYWREELSALPGAEGLRRRRRFLQKLATLFRSLHALNVYHDDLKDANILVAGRDQPGEESFYLLDLEGVRRCRYVSRRRRVKNVVQFNRTMGRLLRRAERLFWLRAYLGEAFGNRRQKREWVVEVLQESVRGDRRSARKR